MAPIARRTIRGKSAAPTSTRPEPSPAAREASREADAARALEIAAIAARDLRGTQPPADWNDRAAVRAWLRALREALHDLAAAAEDQTRAPARRDLGRRLARRTILDASDTLERGLLAAVRTTLTAKGAP